MSIEIRKVEITDIEEQPINIKVELTEYSVSGEILVISIFGEIADLITDENIERIRDKLEEKLTSVDKVEAEAALHFTSSSTHLHKIKLHSNQGWEESKINSTIKNVEDIIQEMIPQKRTIVHCLCK